MNRIWAWTKIKSTTSPNENENNTTRPASQSRRPVKQSEVYARVEGSVLFLTILTTGSIT